MAKTAKKYKAYKKPPIIEAVIEIRFIDSINDQQLNKLVSKQKSKFNIQKIEEIELKISSQAETGAQAETKTQLVGYKLTNNTDSSNIIHVKNNAISISRLPPYEGWAALVGDFKKYYDWYTNKKFKPLNRIGVRYVNRIDIPADDGRIEIENYFKIFPHVPKTKFPDLNRFLVQTVAAIDSDKLLTINLHSAPSPLLKHVSMVFDLDVAQQANLPVSESKLYELLEVVRDKKDAFFENLLTPKCKRLFD